MSRVVSTESFGWRYTFIQDCDGDEDCEYLWSHSHHGVDLTEENGTYGSFATKEKTVTKEDDGQPIWWSHYTFFNP